MNSQATGLATPPHYGENGQPKKLQVGYCRHNGEETRGDKGRQGETRRRQGETTWNGELVLPRSCQGLDLAIMAGRQGET